MSAKERKESKRKSTKERKRAQMSAKERFRVEIANNQAWNNRASNHLGKLPISEFWGSGLQKIKWTLCFAALPRENPQKVLKTLG